MATAAFLALPRAVFYSTAGAALSGGFVYTYIPGGTVPKTTWQNASQSIANANPIILDSAGSCLLYGSGNYQVTVTDSLGNAVPGYSGLSADVATEAGISAAMAPVVAAGTIDASWQIYGQIPATGQFYQSAGAVVNRLNDRLLVGAASLNSGNLNGTGDYVTTNIPQGPTTSVAQSASFSTAGSIGIIGATRTSDAGSLNALDGLGGMFICINDNTVSPGQGEGLYAEAQQKAGAGTTIALEADIANQTGTVTDVNPYSSFASAATPYSMVFQIGSGAGRAGVSNNSAAIVLINNGAAFDKGIVFLNGSLSPNEEALSLASGHSFQWWVSNTQKGAFITGIPVSSTGYYGITLGDAGIISGVSPASGNNSTGSLNVLGVANAVNALSVAGSATGSPVEIQPIGTDTNIDLILAPKGAGLLWLGGPEASTASAGSNGAVPGQVAKYLEVKDASGTVYKIPLFNV